MIYVIIYLAAIVTANLTIIAFGPSVSIINAFLLIGLDLTLRDKLHDLWQGSGLMWKMFLLIVSGSIITVILNWDAFSIALASSVAFLFSGITDTAVYQYLKNKKFLIRVNSSNVAGSLVDSLVFPILAFGFPPLWWIVLGQFVSKVFGGAFWAFILKKFNFWG